LDAGSVGVDYDMTRLWTLAILFTGLPATVTHVAAQGGVPLQGHFTWGPEVSGIQPCGAEVMYWASVREEIRDDLTETYYALTDEPYQFVYVEVAGWIGTGPTDGFALDYDGLWVVTRVDTVRSAGEEDCDHVSLPVWLDSGRVDCESPRTSDIIDCVTVQLMEADARLDRYTTEALLRFAADSDALFRTQDAWDRYRDEHCSAAAEQWGEGTIRPVMFLGCRLSLSEDRLLAVWDAYLRNTVTDLPDPRVDRQGGCR
jgi:uncharacterized protein YecT (DUF1311 family)